MSCGVGHTSPTLSIVYTAVSCNKIVVGSYDLATNCEGGGHKVIYMSLSVASSESGGIAISSFHGGEILVVKISMVANCNSRL